jgi:hypothetical protein
MLTEMIYLCLTKLDLNMSDKLSRSDYRIVTTQVFELLAQVRRIKAPMSLVRRLQQLLADIRAQR